MTSKRRMAFSVNARLGEAEHLYLEMLAELQDVTFSTALRELVQEHAHALIRAAARDAAAVREEGWRMRDVERLGRLLKPTDEDPADAPA